MILLKTSEKFFDVSRGSKGNIGKKRVKVKFKDDHIFNFTNNKVANVILKLASKKASVSNNIPISILKTIGSYLLLKAYQNYERLFKNKMFLTLIKNAQITPCHKKDDKGNKENYRLVSILADFSKVFKRLIHQQLSSYMKPTFSRFLTSFRKNHTTQYALWRMIG